MDNLLKNITAVYPPKLCQLLFRVFCEISALKIDFSHACPVHSRKHMEQSGFSRDSASGKAVLDLLTEFNHRGQTIIMVTHDLKSALRGNRIL